MRLRHLDLNLLIALDALLTTRSVTTAAAILHVSQPSMSGSLARLRDHFADALLVQVGRKLELTPLAKALAGPLREALEKVDAAISIRPTFEPATSRRHFSVAASESTVLALLIEALLQAQQTAPGVTFELLPLEPSQMAAKFARAELDLAFPVENIALAQFPQELVIHDRFLCAVWSGNEEVGAALTLEKYLRLGHAVTRYGFDKLPGFEELTLQELGIHRRVEMSCTSPALLGPLIVGTTRIAMLPSRLAGDQAKVLPLVLHEPPIPFPALRIMMQWHPSQEDDAGLRWLRQLVRDTTHNSNSDA